MHFPETIGHYFCVDFYIKAKMRYYCYARMRPQPGKRTKCPGERLNGGYTIQHYQRGR